MELRRLVKDSDIFKILSIIKQQDLELNNRNGCVTEAVVDEDGEVLGYGIVKLMAEAMLFVDLEKPRPTRAKVMQELMAEAIRGTRAASLDQLHCFVREPNLIRTLKKRYQFEEYNGVILAKDLNG